MAYGGGPGNIQKLNKRLHGFMRAVFIETALHKILHEIEKAIINSGRALVTFLDLEGASDNVAFSAIGKALYRRCESPVMKRQK